MKMLMAVLATAMLAVAAPAMAQQVIMTTGGTVACTPQVTITPSPNQTTTVAGFNPTSYSLGGSDQVQIGSGSGPTASVPKLANLTVTKVFDQCSEPLISAMLHGSSLQTVTLMQLHTVGQVNIPVMTITLTNAYVTSWSLSGSTAPASGNGPQENFSFTYGNICVAHTAITTSGTVGTTTTHCYNVQTNTAS